MKSNDPIAKLPILHPFAESDDGARGFVAENLRRRDESMLDFFHVGAADSAGRDVDQDLSGRNFRNGNRLNDDAARAAIHCRAHSGGRDFRRRAARIGCRYGFGHVVANNSDLVLL